MPNLLSLLATWLSDGLMILPLLGCSRVKIDDVLRPIPEVWFSANLCLAGLPTLTRRSFLHIKTRRAVEMLVVWLCMDGLSMVMGSTYPKAGFLVVMFSRLNEALGTKSTLGTTAWPFIPVYMLGIIILLYITILIIKWANHSIGALRVVSWDQSLRNSSIRQIHWQVYHYLLHHTCCRNHLSWWISYLVHLTDDWTPNHIS